nr:immunoglobulin heavy chain junction region [Macaca mulatta]
CSSEGKGAGILFDSW